MQPRNGWGDGTENDYTAPSRNGLSYPIPNLGVHNSPLARRLIKRAIAETLAD